MGISARVACRARVQAQSRLIRRALGIELLESRRLLAAPPFLEGQTIGTVESTAIVEASGLIASRQQPGVLWTHNDNGDERLFAMDTAGRHLGTYTLSTITARDWEDLAIGPGPQTGVSYLYIADTGDNLRVRSGVTIFRVAEPSVSTAQSPVNVSLTTVDAINLQYPDGPHDAETLIVDPSNGDLYIITKRDARARIYYTPAPQSTAQTITLQYMGQLTWYGAISGDISPDGDELLLLHEDRAYYYARPAGTSIVAALTGPPESIPYTPQRLGEGISFDASGTHYYTNSEGVNEPLWFYQRGSQSAGTTLIPAGAMWKYCDDGNDQGTAWRTRSFNDAAWGSGAAQLGYGDGDEATMVYGGVAKSRPLTTYYRTHFDVPDPTNVTGLTLNLLRDDGAVVYINGQEVIRSNMPAGPVNYLTKASRAVGNGDENQWYTFTISPSVLVAGPNSVAVEIHQSGTSSSDISFDLALKGQLATASTPPAPTPQPAPEAEHPLTADSTSRTAPVVVEEPRPTALSAITDSRGSSLVTSIPLASSRVFTTLMQSPRHQLFEELGLGRWSVRRNAFDPFEPI